MTFYKILLLSNLFKRGQHKEEGSDIDLAARQQNQSHDSVFTIPYITI